ncbi:MAG: hypothetical protein Q9227_004396 [Pyrenula ochraceoflavens]
MSPKVFATGTTGFIGGDALHDLVQRHPDWEITCLVRNTSKGAKVASEYPKIRLVYGDLDSSELIEEEAKKADIIYPESDFANCDHVASAEAIAKGASAHTADRPAWWIHTSGTGILTWETTDKDAFGQRLEREYNDWDGIKDLMSIPDQAVHRNVDKIVLAASASNPTSVKTAIVCPPTIYGRGRGPDNKDSVQVPKASKQILSQKKGFLVGAGENVWTQVHVHDLSDLYILLGEAAATGGGKATWNEEGYYLAENGSFVWGDIFRQIAKVAHQKGLLTSDNVESLPVAEIDKFAPDLKYYVGTSSRGTSVRGKKLLGWNPHRPTIFETLGEAVDVEASKLGLVKGHAEQVAS